MIHQATSSTTRFKAGPCRTISRQHKSWGRLQADLVRRTGLSEEETSVTSNQHLVLLNLKGNSERGEYFLDGRRSGFVRRRPGSVLFIPAGCHWHGWEAGAPSAAYLSILIDPQLVADLIGRTGGNDQPTPSPDLGCEDLILMNAARGIGAEIGDRNPMSTLLIESYVSTIFAQLLRKQAVPPTTRVTGGLTPSVFKRVVETINDDLAADFSLSDLARLADLSIPHFCRAFKQSAGCPPYTFIIQRRIAHAKDLLRHTDKSVTEIALECGFSSSSHFANVFRREVGATAGSYRSV